MKNQYFILGIFLSSVMACSGSSSGDGDGDGDPMTNPDLTMVDDSVAPVDSDDLFTFLQDDAYDGYLAEPEIHRSEGPHGDVLTYINQRLAQSLSDRNEIHPVGSSAVKEFYNGTELSGWAVEVKVAEEGGGDAWYWYENFSADTNNPVADGTGERSCVGCHSQRPDFVVVLPRDFGL